MQAYINAGWIGFKSVTENVSLSIVDTLFNNAISIYPNPIQNTLNINLATGQSLGSIEIFTLLGEKILETDTTPINLNNLNSGIYLLKIENTTGKFAVRKIIKQ